MLVEPHDSAESGPTAPGPQPISPRQGVGESWLDGCGSRDVPKPRRAQHFRDCRIARPGRLPDGGVSEPASPSRGATSGRAACRLTLQCLNPPRTRPPRTYRVRERAAASIGPTQGLQTSPIQGNQSSLLLFQVALKETVRSS